MHHLKFYVCMQIDRVRFRELTADQVFGSVHETYAKL